MLPVSPVGSCCPLCGRPLVSGLRVALVGPFCVTSLYGYSLRHAMKPVKVVTVTFVYVGGRDCLNFAGTRKWRRTPAPEELLTQPTLLSVWAVQAGLLDHGIEVAEDDLEAAIALREAIYRTVTARLEGRRPKSADVELINEHGSHAQLTPRLDRSGAVRREGTSSQLFARLAADLLDLLAGPDIEKVKGCAHPGCSRLYVDSSRAQNRHWCGMGTCGNKAKVRAFRERQRASESGVPSVAQSRTKG
jgi:predicted RNA-binding Zn ribbon-like protein